MPTIYLTSFSKSDLQKYCCSHKCIQQTNLLCWVVHHSFTYSQNYCSNPCVSQFAFHTYSWSTLCSKTQTATMHTSLTQQLPRYCTEHHYFNGTSHGFSKLNFPRFFKSNCRLHVSVMSGKWDKCAEYEDKDKKEWKGISLLQKL